MEICGIEHANGGESKAESAECEPLFFAKIVSDGSCRCAAGNAAHERAASGPAYAPGIQVKQLAQKANRATDHDVVVSEQQSA
jgi:hypothetical protein